MATRYSDQTKQEVVQFVKDYDAKHGRGGQSAAKKKYKINPISIKKWCVDQGYASGPTRKKKAAAKPAAAKRATRKPAKRKAKAASKPAAATAAKSAASPVKAGTTAATLKKMGEITEKIEALQAQFEDLKKSL
ncbi:MAG: hypothetical protein P1V20_00340 [Verrucomicrobiales bacterium]|nr:hypothetical protein [Verrucomicrobiales bacterium]